jgi:hypothetical protein
MHPALRSFSLGLAALVILAPAQAWCGTVYARQITVGSGLFIGLKRDKAQQGTITVKSKEGQELGKLTYAGSFVEIQDKGTYRLEFSPEVFDLNLAIIRSRTSTGAYMLNLSRGGNGTRRLKAKGAWDGTREGNVVVNEKEGRALIAVD